MSAGTVTLTITGTDADFDQEREHLAANPPTPVSDVLFELSRLVEPHAGQCTLTVILTWTGEW
jgi:hypothetical protein